MSFRIFCFSISMFFLGISQAQENDYFIEKYSYESGFKDNFIVDIDVSKDDEIYIANRLQILKGNNGQFKEIIDLSDYPRVLDFAVDDRNFIWLLIQHNGNESFDKKVVVLDPINYEEVNTQFYTEDSCSLYQTGWFNFFKDQNFNLYLNSANHSVPNLKVTSESNLLKYAPTRIKLSENLLYSRQSREKFSGFGANKQIQTQKSRRYNATRIDAPEIRNFLTNCLLEIRTIPYLSDDKVDELCNIFNYRFFFSPYDDEALIYNQNKFCLVNSQENSIINISELFPKEFAHCEILNAIKIKDDIWISTSDGLLKLSRKEKLYKTYISGNFTQTRNIISVGQDSILVATEHGIFLVNLKTKNETRISRFYTTGLFSNGYGKFYGMGKPQILEIYQEHPKFESIEDIFFEHPKDKAFNSGIHIKGGDPILMSDEILYSYVEKSREFKPFPDFPEVGRFSHLRMIDSTIFLLGSNNIFEVDPYTKTIKESELFKDLQVNNITYLHHENQTEVYWICTNGYGLIKWNSQTGEKKVFELSHGLQSLNIHSIFPDSKNRYWMSTDLGISIMDRASENIVTITHENGLHQNEMNRHSYFQLEDKSIIFGSIDGLIHLNPDEIEIPFKQFDLRASHFEYNLSKSANERIIESEVSNNEIILEQSFVNPIIQLDIDKNTFFNNIRYRFQNSQSINWMRSANGKIPLSNITEDDELIINSQIGLNKWSKPLIIDIKIKKPFYKNLYFYLSAASSLVLIVFVWSLISNFRSRKRADLIQEKVDLQTKELSDKNLSLEKALSLNKMLFSIIGHDLKSPLSSLLDLQENFSFLIERKENENILKLAKAVENNSKNVLGVIDRLLDWSTTLERKKIIAQDVSLSQILDQCISDLKYGIQNKRIRIQTHSITNQVVHFDLESLIIVIRNLLHNAIKFSSYQGVIRIDFRESQDYQEIMIIDFGIGLFKSELEQINANNQLNTTLGTKGEKGLGLGLKICRELLKRNNSTLMAAHTHPKGSTFIIRIKKEIN